MPPRLPPPPADTPITVRPLEPDDFPAIELLFGPNGACGGCWCMYWRVPGGKAWAAGKGEANKAAFRALVESGAASGVLAFAGDEPVGWAAVAPREGFLRVARSRVLGREVPVGAWSLNCFYIPSRWRKRGVASALLAGAVDLAWAHGATEVEAYPVEPKGDGSMPAAFAYTGVVSMFAAAGFALLDRPGLRPVWVRRVGGARTGDR